ncbi:MAG: hypothetical protein KDE68_12535, partial [Rhodocyclaceae bacterium]|nr:hypothetical protein [Rhodocyclaceae bacterium]
MCRLPRLRSLIVLAVVTALCGCAAMKDAVDAVKAKLPAPSADETAEQTDTPAAGSAPKATPRPRPRVSEPTPAVVVPPAATPALPPGSPAWLKGCAALQVAGGIVRCDADRLLAQPAATVQVFTR